MAEFKKPYDKAYGFWHVTTEGDCEGRSTTDLGVFEENIKGAITMAEFKKPYDKAEAQMPEDKFMQFFNKYDNPNIWDIN